MTPGSVVLRNLLILMNKKIRNLFADEWASSLQEMRSLILVSTLLVFVLNLFLWKFVLRHLIEFVNRFKQMLKVMPTSILLKNRNLKGFLIASSKGRLNAVKKDL